MTGKNFLKFQAEVVQGKCPTCDELTLLVGLTKQFYRCMNCGADLEQHINGKISYLPAVVAPEGATPFVREWRDDDGEKVQRFYSTRTYASQNIDWKVSQSL